LGDALVHLIKEGGDVDMTIVLPYREESDERRLREGKWASAGPKRINRRGPLRFFRN
jgi:hypothetical protein